MATIGFSTHFPWGEPTEFIQKMWAGLIQNKLADWREYEKFSSQAVKHSERVGEIFMNGTGVSASIPKVHSLREDKNNFWYPGRKIHAVVFNRSKNRFQFVPVLECKSVQKVSIKKIPLSIPIGNYIYSVKIDEKVLGVYLDSDHYYDTGLLNLAENDGFSSVENFFRWFSKDWTGKIIHWTNLKY